MVVVSQARCFSIPCNSPLCRASRQCIRREGSASAFTTKSKRPSNECSMKGSFAITQYHSIEIKCLYLNHRYHSSRVTPFEGVLVLTQPTLNSSITRYLPEERRAKICKMSNTGLSKAIIFLRAQELYSMQQAISITCHKRSHWTRVVRRGGRTYADV